jgi:anti-sigma regulatory factor (Ser/Thr protein kinase)
MPRRQNPEIRDFILRHVEAHPNVATLAVREFGLSRTAVGGYMRRLMAEGLISAEGQTRGRRYALKALVDETFRLERNGRWTEDTVWRQHILPKMRNAPKNVVNLYHYGCTEMVNNVLEHSRSPDVLIHYRQSHAEISIQIVDHGVGIFNKIQHDFGLEDARTALLELCKGKLTSDKKHHSGEGIYFTSRMFSSFGILSGQLFYTRTREGDDWLVETRDEKNDLPGTAVKMLIRADADWTQRSIFEKYQGDDVRFRATHVPVALGRYPGELLVSRSQAKRLLARFTDFAEVILDFAGVDEIGQAFADEIFRVFSSAHPFTPILAVNTNGRIERVIKFVQANAPSS